MLNLDDPTSDRRMDDGAQHFHLSYDPTYYHRMDDGAQHFHLSWMMVPNTFVHADGFYVEDEYT